MLVRFATMICLVLALAACTPPDQETVSVGPDDAVSPPARLEIPTIHGEGSIQWPVTGKGPVLMVLWGSWSDACRHQIDEIAQARSVLADRGVAVQGLMIDRRSTEEIRMELDSLEVGFPVGIATEAVLSALGPVRAIPTTLVVDADGSVRSRLPGVISSEELIAALDDVSDG